MPNKKGYRGRVPAPHERSDAPPYRNAGAHRGRCGATLLPIKIAPDYIYVSASSCRKEFKVKVLKSINSEYPEIIAKPDEMPVVKGWYDRSIQP